MENIDFVAHYEHYYQQCDDDRARWRALTGEIKASHVVDAWRDVVGASAPAVIDIGCGDGAVSAVLAESGFAREVAGVEVSQAAVAAAIKRGVRNASFRVMSPGNVPYPDDRFDLAVLSHVLEHVEDARGLVREAARVAEFVFIEVPLELTVRMPRDFEWTCTGHINFYNRKLMRQLLQSMGHEILFERSWPPRRVVYSFRHGPVRGHFKWLLGLCVRLLLRSRAEALIVHQGGFMVGAAPPTQTAQ